MVKVTVNGIPVEVIVDDEVRDEINQHRKVEVGTVSRAVRAHIVTNKIRNISHSRSGRGRVIYSRGMDLRSIPACQELIKAGVLR